MDFSTKSLKNLVSDVTTVFTRAKQYAEETIGTAERTELDSEYEQLAERADCYRQWTERIVSKLEAVIQPNPNMRYGEMLIERTMGSNTELIKSRDNRLRNLDYLGNDMIDAGIAFGPSTLYGSALVKVGKHQTELGQAEKDFVQNAYRTIIIPLRKFLDEDMKTIAKERKVLETKRLDLDVAKNRLRKAKSQDSQNNPKLKPEMIENEIEEAERDLKHCQEEFDRQIEITKLLLEGITSAQANHVRCLNDFAQCQIEYYHQCFRHMANLQREINQPPPPPPSSTLNDQSLPNGGGGGDGGATLKDSNNPATIKMTSNHHKMRTTSNNSAATAMEAIDLIHHTNIDNNSTTVPMDLSSSSSSTTTTTTSTINKRRAKCLNTYYAQSNDELALLADEIIYVTLIDHKNQQQSIDDTSDWMYGERLSDGRKGKVPVAYLEILN
ncbi:SH3 domain containing GRB2 like, endophilin-B isoform X1 [Dermatophagoides farinae]|uniref:SH3 domain containing GRB2 like, endophilin-B isoform X1 n=1 Tax=Dermatophagoides farinae TaxID=6954 RepID=UPI003F62CCAC